jgi:hypothetical protein
MQTAQSTLNEQANDNSIKTEQKIKELEVCLQQSSLPPTGTGSISAKKTCTSDSDPRRTPFFILFRKRSA